MPPENKGSGFRCTLFAVKDMLDAARYAEYTARLPDATRALTVALPTASEWVDAAHEIALIDTAVHGMFAGDMARAFEIGLRSTRADLKGIYRVFIKVLHPEFVVKRAPMIWAQYYRDNGTSEVLESGKDFARLHYKEVPLASEAWWHNLRGSITAAAEATRIKDVSVEFLDANDLHTRVLEARWRV